MNIDVVLVSKLIATQFPKWKSLEIKPVEFGGNDNRTFHLGEQMVVRLPSAERYSQKVAKEYFWLPKLAPLLPLPIPRPLAMGSPNEDYPWSWSVYSWLEGENAAIGRISDLSQFAVDLAQFLTALQKVDLANGPEPGLHNFFRGGLLKVYDDETRQAIAKLRDKIDGTAATKLWESALQAAWRDKPVWLHGDISAANLLVKNGKLSAVIDFGGLAVGDPACDLTIAWTFFSRQSRESFRSTLNLDAATWERARGWALWKALITLAECSDINSLTAKNCRCVISDVLAG